MFFLGVISKNAFSFKRWKGRYHPKNALQGGAFSGASKGPTVTEERTGGAQMEQGVHRVVCFCWGRRLWNDKSATKTNRKDENRSGRNAAT